MMSDSGVKMFLIVKGGFCVPFKKFSIIKDIANRLIDSVREPQNENKCKVADDLNQI